MTIEPKPPRAEAPFLFARGRGPLLSRIAIGAGVALALSLSTLLMVSWHEEIAEEEAHSHALRHLSDVRGRLETVLNARLHLVRGLAAFAKGRPDLDQNTFERFARDLVGEQKGIRSLQLAPDAVVTYVHPQETNRAAIGHDLLADPARRDAAERAIRERQFVLAGPVTLRQGGVAVIGRLPLYVEKDGGERFWGFSIILIDLPILLEESGILSQAGDFEFALRGKHGLGAKGEVFFGDPVLFATAPEILDISLPHGTWQLTGAPAGGWGVSRWEDITMLSIGLALSVLAGVFVFGLLQHPVRLRLAVADATEALRKAYDELDDRVRERTASLVTEIADRKRAEAALKASEARLAAAQRMAHLGNWEWDIETGAEVWSDEQFRIFGYEPGTIRPTYATFLNALHPNDKPAVKAAVERALAGDPYDIDFRIERPDGRLRHIHAQGAVTFDDKGQAVSMHGTAQDITEAREAQAHLIQVSKLASLGEMATGVAHEINQPLNIIRMAADSVVELHKKGDIDPDFLVTRLEWISSQTERAAGIIDHMRMFGRKAKEEAHPIFLPEIVGSATGFMQEQLSSAGIEVRIDLPEDCPEVLGHRIQTEQVLLNLLTNARDALQTRAEEANAPPKRIDVRVEAPSGNSHVRMIVEDTGGGISETDLEHVFEPFFTTKEIGKGTGVGLSIAYGIVTDMGGTIIAANTDNGARFTLEFPALAEDPG